MEVGKSRQQCASQERRSSAVSWPPQGTPLTVQSTVENPQARMTGRRLGTMTIPKESNRWEEGVLFLRLNEISPSQGTGEKMKKPGHGGGSL